MGKTNVSPYVYSNRFPLEMCESVCVRRGTGSYTSKRKLGKRKRGSKQNGDKEKEEKVVEYGKKEKKKPC